jgi:cytosine/adenosine deaminase-related metal-dependent hydrolase
VPQFRAAWLLPISQPPIRDGWVRTERGRITAFGPHRRGQRRPPGEIDLGAVAILPGLVNAHTHLELSWMRGRIPQGGDFPGWIRAVIALQRAGNEAGDLATQAAIGEAIAEARRTGTVLFGDISNTLASVAKLIETDSAAVVFRELIGFKAERARQLAVDALASLPRIPSAGLIRGSLAAHAPYSVSPALFKEIRHALEHDPFARCSVHLGESEAETEFLRNGSGPWRSLLEDLGAWDASWRAPACDPVEYLDRMGFITDRLLIVHGVQFGLRELARIKSSGATLVTCPRSNRLTGAGTPQVQAFYASGARIAIGTDSLASVPDLNMFNELAELRRLAPDVPAGKLLESATLKGAGALGFEALFGSIEAGKSASIIAVAVPRIVPDVAEYLVNGMSRADISNLEAP